MSEPSAGPLPLRAPVVGAPLLAVKDLHAGYGSASILRGVNLSIGQGEAICVIGPNGAGKTTLLRTICGVVRVRSGSIAWDGTTPRRRSTRALASSGLVHVPEGVCVFAPLTVQENLEVAALAIGRRPSTEEFDRVFELFPVLWARRKQRAGTLSGGEQRMVGIGRGLLAKPRLLVLDEPSGGLARVLIRQLAVVLSNLHADGLAILMAEQNLEIVEAVSERTYLIDRGLVTWEGPTAVVPENEVVAAALLGGGLGLS